MPFWVYICLWIIWFLLFWLIARVWADIEKEAHYRRQNAKITGFGVGMIAGLVITFIFLVGYGVNLIFS